MEMECNDFSTAPPNLKVYNEHSTHAVNVRSLKSNNLFTCHMCNKIFATKSALQKHVAIHSGKKSFCCCVCNKRFSQKCNLIVHFRKHSGIFPYQCHNCNKGFNRRKTYEQHRARHHNATLFSCDMCKKSFPQLKDLQSHQLLHSNKKLHVCVSCKKCFANKANLKVHSRIHTNELPYGCSYCSKRFRQNHVLRRHILVHTGERPYNCSTCHKRFASRSVLKNHALVHLRQFVCSTCNATFSNSNTLSKHVLLHSGVCPFVCDVCNKGFITSSHLQRHKFVHLNHRPFTCDVCQKQFKYKGNLNVHKLVHSASAYFVCETCGKDFVHKNNFKRHLRTHSGERPFVCNKCDARFTVKHSLNIHYLRHTNSAPAYKCETCGSSFRACSTLNYHKLKHLSNMTDKNKQEKGDVISVVPQDLVNSDQTELQNTNQKSPIQFLIAVKIAVNNNNQPSLMPSQNTVQNTSDTLKPILPFKQTPNLNESELQEVQVEKSNIVVKQQFRKIAPKPLCSPSGLPSPTKSVEGKLDGNNLKPLTLSAADIKMGSAFVIHADTMKPAIIPFGEMQYYECATCKKVFKNKKTFKQHNSMHEKNRPYSCNICEQTFTANSSLKRHLQRHSDQPSYHCNICQKTFFQLGNLKVHQQKSCSAKNSQCDKEAKVVPVFTDNVESSESQINSCLRIQPEEQNNFKETSDTNEKSGDKISKNREKWICRKCNKSFKLYVLLKSHKCLAISKTILLLDKVNSHNVQDTKYAKAEEKSNDHQMSETNPQSNVVSQRETTKFTKVCHICSNVFSTDQVFNRHMYSHTTKKSYKCVCKKRFKNELSLQAHRLIHTL